MITLKDTMLKFHRRLSADQWNVLLKLERLTNRIADERYHIGTALEHNNMNASECDYNDLCSLEDNNATLLETILSYFERNELERIDEVLDLIETEAKEAIEKSFEHLQSIAA